MNEKQDINEIYINILVISKNDFFDQFKSSMENLVYFGDELLPHKKVCSYTIDGYCASWFKRTLLLSSIYRHLVAKYHNDLLKIDTDGLIRINLIQPKQEIIDYVWGYKIERLVRERLELEHAMSWFSTLGGAFSALGDYYNRCAVIAAKISYQQFKIAIRIGEPPLLARCNLYLSLSLIQQNKLKAAKKIIRNQYEVAKVLKDQKLKNMCHGIWAKLKYVNGKRMLS